MRVSLCKLAVAVCLPAVFVFTTAPLHAGPYVPQGPFVTPAPGPSVPTPTQVPGKEYSDHLDKNTGSAVAGPLPDPEQVISWDGIGGVRDSFDYTGSRLPNDDNDREVDALANNGDALFFSVQANASALLFSVDGDPRVHVEGIGGGFGVWATPPVIDQHGVTDLDGLEVWGPEPGINSVGPVSDANRYSLEDPPPSGDPLGTSVWGYVPAGNTSFPVWGVAELAAAIAPLSPGGPDHLPLIETMLNVDGMMNFGFSTEGEPDPNEQIIFTIDPILDAAGLVVFDGGEIFTYTRNAAGAPAAFLFHGGHLWNTAFGVMTTFDLQSENVNALESVSTPLPAAAWLGMLGLGALGIGKLRRKH